MKLYTNDISKYFDFWRFLRLSEESLKYTAESGDLLLCQTKKRLVMGGGSGNVDKICLVVKLVCEFDESEEEIFILRVGHNFEQPMILQSWDEFRVYKS